MKNTIKILTRTVVIALIIMGMAACNPKPTSIRGISVSIQPQKYIVEQLMGDTIPINVLIPKGSSPATYAPSPSQIKSLSESTLYLRIGHIGFEEAWIPRIKEINPHLKIEDTSTGISYIRGEDHYHGDHVHKGGIDPHIWTSPKTMITVIKNTQEALTTAFPQNKENIIENGKALLNKVSQLDEKYAHTLETVQKRRFYIFHPAYTYLARDYGLQQISIEDKGKEPSAQWLRQLIDKGKEQETQAIFIQEEFDQRNAEIILTN